MHLLKDYRGTAIRLTDERLVHILEHPEMVGLESSVGEALLYPELVVRSPGDPLVTLSYKLVRGTRVGD